MNLLVLKITLIPAVIALVTLAVRKWGNKMGGLIGSMPWTAGPILLFFILEQGKAFGIHSIHGTMTGILALVSFCFSYAVLSRRLSWLPTLLLSYVIFTVTVLIVNYLELGLKVSYVLGMIAIILALQFFPVLTEQPAKSRRLPFDILIRMGVGTLFVLVITGLARVLGPNWSGIFTPFPIMTSVLAIFAHSLQGSSAVIAVLRGIVIGLLGFTTFLFLQAFLLTEFSVAASFGLAFIANVLISLIAIQIW
jgi:uncharacterized membrane protein (GlpM family)